MSGNEQKNRDFVLESSLQSYFYSQLQEFNEKSTQPLPNEAIYYSSLVMDRFGESGNYFEVIEGKVRDKILGMKLLETHNMNKEERKRTLKDIGDTALVICGFFSDSLNRKIIDTSYYQELGQTAYQRLNTVIPTAYDVPAFFEQLSLRFSRLTTVMSLVSEKTLNNSMDGSEAYLIVTKKLVG
ncbi:MAG: hypothetical protein NXH75_00290 [Halobacteriovoraceae bacterium]|nr:hypothetical protein [Halobacteriovoraceae bacterium]